MSIRGNTHKKVIRQRIQFLEDKIAERGKLPSSYEKEEMYALKWIIRRLAAVEAELYSREMKELRKGGMVVYKPQADGGAK